MKEKLPGRAAVFAALSRSVRASNKAEYEVWEAQAEVCGAREALQRAEDSLLLSGQIEGKNAEIREARLREETTGLRFELAAKEENLRRRQLRLRCRRDHAVLWQNTVLLVASSHIRELSP